MSVTGFDVYELRLRLGLTQTELAARLGVTADTIRGWEHGRRSPNRSAQILLSTLSATVTLLQ